MIGFNHAITGALIGKFVPLPLAIPLAFASHFILDALPHYGIDSRKRDKSKFWRIFCVVDFFAAWSLAAICIAIDRYDMLLCGLIAASPDFVWVTRLLKHGSFNMVGNNHWFNKLHARIQFERPWGIYLEVPLAIILFYITFIWS